MIDPTELETRLSKVKSGIARRGFASMSEEKHKSIASKGGKAVSENKAHMSKIGKMGGLKRAENHRAKQKSNPTTK